MPKRVKASPTAKLSKSTKLIHKPKNTQLEDPLDSSDSCSTYADQHS